jgi:hypothetical protein
MGMFDKDKSYIIGVWDMTFYVVDTETDELIRNKDGTVKQFCVEDYDYSYMADGLGVDDLTEVQNTVHLCNGELVK